jgi:hypothetical protein
VPKEIQSFLEIINPNAKMLKATTKINIEMKIEKCVNERKIEEIMLFKCSNKRDQQKGKNRRKV